MEQNSVHSHPEISLQLDKLNNSKPQRKSSSSSSSSQNSKEDEVKDNEIILSPLKRNFPVESPSKISKKRLSIAQMNKNFSLQVLPQVHDILKKPSNLRSQQDIQILHQCFKSNAFFQKMRKQLTPQLYALLLRDLMLEEHKQLDPVFYFGSPSRNFYVVLQGDLFILCPVGQVSSKKFPNNKSVQDKLNNQQQQEQSYDYNTVPPANNEDKDLLEKSQLQKSLDNHYNKKQKIQQNKKKKLMQHYFPQQKQNAQSQQQQSQSPRQQLQTQQNIKNNTISRQQSNNNLAVVTERSNETNRQLESPHSLMSPISQNNNNNNPSNSIAIDQAKQICLDANPGFVIVKTLQIGDSFGEIALSQDIARTATVIPRTDCKLAVLSSKSYKKILDDYYQEQLNQKINFVKQISLFEGVNLDNYIGVVMEMKREFYTQNQIIYTENDDSDTIYFVYSGQVELSKQTMRRDPVLFDPVFQDIDLRIDSYRRRLMRFPKNTASSDQLKSRDGKSSGNVNSQQKRKRVLLASKTQFNWFGEVEAFNDCQKRFTQAQCISPQCEVYSITKKKFIENILSIDVVDRLNQSAKAISNWRSKFFDNQVVKVAFQRDILLNNFTSDKVAQQLVNQKMKEKFLQNPISIFQSKTKEEAKQTAKNIYFNQIKNFMNKFLNVKQTIQNLKESSKIEIEKIDKIKKEKEEQYYQEHHLVHKSNLVTQQNKKRADSYSPSLSSQPQQQQYPQLVKCLTKQQNSSNNNINTNQSFSTDVCTTNKNISQNSIINIQQCDNNINKQHSLFLSPQNQKKGLKRPFSNNVISPSTNKGNLQQSQQQKQLQLNVKVNSEYFSLPQIAAQNNSKIESSVNGDSVVDYCNTEPAEGATEISEEVQYQLGQSLEQIQNQGNSQQQNQPIILPQILNHSKSQQSAPDLYQTPPKNKLQFYMHINDSLQEKSHDTSILKRVISQQSLIYSPKVNKKQMAQLPSHHGSISYSQRYSQQEKNNVSLDELFEEIQKKTKLQQRYKILLDNSILFKKDSKNFDLADLESSKVIQAKLLKQQKQKHKQIISLREQFYLYEKLASDQLGNVDKMLSNKQKKNKFNQLSSAVLGGKDVDSNVITGRSRAQDSRQKLQIIQTSLSPNNEQNSKFNIQQQQDEISYSQSITDAARGGIGNVKSGRIFKNKQFSIKGQLCALCSPTPLQQNLIKGKDGNTSISLLLENLHGKKKSKNKSIFSNENQSLIQQTIL